MSKPIAALRPAEAATVSSVEVVAGVSNDQLVSWDVTLHSIASREPIAHDVVALPGGGLKLITDYIDVMVSQVGLRRVTSLSAERTPRRLGARIESGI